MKYYWQVTNYVKYDQANKMKQEFLQVVVV